MKRNFFTRIFVLYVVVIVVSFYFVESYITDTVRENYITTVHDHLRVQAEFAAEDIDFATGRLLNETVSRLKKKTGARITILAPDGSVLGDSDAQPSSMENHAGRPEILQALTEGVGSSVRYSRTIRHDLLYTAVRVGGLEHPRGIIRLALPLQDIATSINSIRLRLLAAVGILLALVTGISLVHTKRLQSLVSQVTEFSDALAHGELNRRLILEGVGEFEAIAANLNAMAERLSAMMTENSEEQERLSAILRNVPDALLILDADNTILMASVASREFFKTAPITGRQVAEIIRAPEFFSLLDNVREEYESQNTELYLEQPARYVVIKASPLIHQERALSGLIVLFHDITEMKRIDQVRKDFVANVSHELKTPIAAIKGFSDTLLEGALEDPEHARRFIGIIKSNSERIDALVEDLMTISRIELGVIKIEKASVDVHEAMELATALVAERAAEKGLQLDIALAGSHRIQADRNRLIQILTNLVDNAVKFTEKGKITLGMDKADGREFIFVSDTGIGIPPKHLPRIGERFYRVDPSRSRELGGTGLGLAIVKHLVRAHGWQMRVESIERQGTTVQIFIS